MSARPAILLVGLLLGLLSGSARADGPAPVEVLVNDALIKDRALPGVVVTARPAKDDRALQQGTTDAAGRATLSLTPGPWRLTCELAGFIALRDSPLEVRTGGQVVTISLLPSAESEGPGGPPVPLRVALVLNWGSNKDEHVRDCDSHLQVGQTEVFFGARSATLGPAGATTIALDVDDMDWGGPETITIKEPGQGRYEYWVHRFSPESTLGRSEVVVRLLVGDEQVGEYRAGPGVVSPVWRPFEHLVVGADGAVEVVPRKPDELAAEQVAPTASSTPASPEPEATPPRRRGGVFITMIIGWMLWRSYRRRASQAAATPGAPPGPA